MRGRWGLLIATVVGGVGLVLFLLGFDSHTTEALPFGVVMLGLSVVIALPSIKALRAATQPEGAWTPKPGETADAPPTTVKCESCGSPAPLELSHPTHAVCAHCEHRTVLPPALAKQLAEAAAAVKLQAQSERQIAAVIATLPERESKLRAALLRLTATLVLTAGLAGIFGFVRRFEDDDWQGFASFALLAGPLSLGLGLWAARTIPRVTLGIVARWTALKLPGVEGLGCRVCGAPLPKAVAAVLRCEYCGADSLASPAVLARVEAQASHARASVLSVTHQSRDADERAAFSLVALPVLVLVVWFAIGAFAGGVGLRALGDVQLGADDAPHFTIVEGCLAYVNDGELIFDYETKHAGTASKLMSPSELIGRRVAGRGVIDRVWRELRTPGRHSASMAGWPAPLYLPSKYGGGEKICFAE